MDVLKHPLKPEIPLSVSSPLRNAIVEKFRAAEVMDNFVYGLMIPIARFNFPDSLSQSLSRNNIKDRLNSDKALLYVGHFYFACLADYAERRRFEEDVQDIIVHGHIKFCKLYAITYSTEVPEKEAARIFIRTLNLLKKKDRSAMNEILANILADNVLHLDDSLTFDFANIVACTRIWITAYMPMATGMVDGAQKTAVHNE